MPTVGWIVEGAIDRFWESQPLPAPRDVPPQRFVCGRCGLILGSPEELRRHYSLKHPLELPCLYIRGEPVLREAAIRSTPSATEIELVQCTYCEVQIDGQSWSRIAPLDFRKQFVRSRDSIWNVRLVHERAEDGSRTQEQYHLRFRVPTASALDSVDEHFLRTLVKDELTHDDLARYQAGLPTDVAAREYGAALGDYALAILLKERRTPPHSHVRFEEFVSKMGMAMDVLRAFDRPVAMAVCESIRFNLNDFRDSFPIMASELAPGMRFFQRVLALSPTSPTRAASTPERKARRAICPIDHISHCLLSVCSERAPARDAIKSLETITEGPLPVSEQDLGKIHVICAAGHLRSGDKTSARPHLLAIQYDPVFRDWAQVQLPSDSSNG